MDRADLADVIRKRCGMDLPPGEGPVLTQRDLTRRATEAGFTLDEGQVSKVVRRLLTWKRNRQASVAAWAAALALDPGLVALAMRVSSGEASQWEADIVRLNVTLWTPADDLAFRVGGQPDLVFPGSLPLGEDEVRQAGQTAARVLRPHGTDMPRPRSRRETPTVPEFLSPSGD